MGRFGLIAFITALLLTLITGTALAFKNGLIQVPNQIKIPSISNPIPTPQVNVSNTSPSPTPQTTIITTQGEVVMIQRSSRPNITLITLREGDTSTNIEASSQTKVSDENNKAVELSYLRSGMTIQARGSATEGAIAANDIKVLASPNIIVYEPKDGDRVGNQFSIKGIARVFENVLQIRIKNNRTNATYVKQNVEANSPDTGQYGDYSYNVNLTNQIDLRTNDSLVIEVFQNSAKDGSEIDKKTITVLYK